MFPRSGRRLQDGSHTVHGGDRLRQGGVVRRGARRAAGQERRGGRWDTVHTHTRTLRLQEELLELLSSALLLSILTFSSSPSLRYFQCLPKFGLFAPVHKVIRIGFPSTSPAKAKKSKRMAMGVSSLAHSPSSSSISSVSSVASSVSGRPSRAGLVRRRFLLPRNSQILTVKVLHR